MSVKALPLGAELEPISEQEMEPFLKVTTDRGTDNWLALGIIAKRINREWVERPSCVRFY